MSRHLIRAVVFWAAMVAGASAQERPATLELLLAAGSTATVDGQAVQNGRAFSVNDLKPGEIRRLKVVAKFSDGTADERSVDISSGQQLRVAIPRPGPEKAAVVAAHQLVPINSAAVSARGKRIALGLDARTVILWDTAAGRPVRALVGHTKPVLSVAFSPDGSKLLSGSADTTAVLWEVETGKPIRTIKGHTGAVASVAFAPDGKRFLTGSPEGLAIVWETDTGEPVHRLKWRNILGVAYSPDGNTLATASADSTATLWDAKTGKQTALLRGHREDVNCVAFSPDGRRIVTGSSDDSGAVWDVATGSRITRTRGHTVNIHSAAFTADGRRVITGEREELVVMSDAATGFPVRTFVGHGAEIVSIVPGPDGKTMLTGSRDGTARLWDLSTGRELLVLTTDGTGKEWAAVSPDGLFDGTEGGRRALGYRFPKGGFGEVDRYFDEGFRPGLLAEVWRGERPFPAQPLGRSKPPLVKLVAPKSRVSNDANATLTADIADQGGGVGAIAVENNGIRVAVATKVEPGSGAIPARVTFSVPLVPGANRIGVRAADREGTRESAAAEIELAHPKVPGQRGRLFVVAVGIGEYAESGWNVTSAKVDTGAVAALLRDRAANLFDRVDVVPVFDRAATRTTIDDTIRDVVELTRPQDAILVYLCGRGDFIGDRAYLAPHDLRPDNDLPEDFLPKRGLPLHVTAKVLGTALAQKRMLVFDVSGFGGPPAGQSEFTLRGTIERWGRANGLHVLAAVNRTGEFSDRGGRGLARSLLDAAGSNATDVTDWFHSAAVPPATKVAKETVSRLGVQASLRTKGFPLLGAKP